MRFQRLPPVLAKDAEALWTDTRIDRVLEKLERHRIALEINSRYRIPLHRALRRAKACGIGKDDMWFPVDSIRRSRKAVIYNRIEE